MQNRHPFKACFTGAVISVFLATTWLQARADDTGKARPPALRKIMQDLGKDMQIITDGISREDWEMVATVAPRIAEHLQPPLAEKMRLLKFAGADAGKFKDYDKAMHQAAQVLRQAAVHGDGPAVIESFATLQSSCLACHQSFRKRFGEHFHAP